MSAQPQSKIQTKEEFRIKEGEWSAQRQGNQIHYQNHIPFAEILSMDTTLFSDQPLPFTALTVTFKDSAACLSFYTKVSDKDYMTTDLVQLDETRLYVAFGSIPDVVVEEDDQEEEPEIVTPDIKAKVNLLLEDLELPDWIKARVLSDVILHVEEQEVLSVWTEFFLEQRPFSMVDYNKRDRKSVV